MKTVLEFMSSVGLGPDQGLRELLEQRDRETRSAALLEASRRVRGFNSMSPESVAWHLERMADDAEFCK